MAGFELLNLNGWIKNTRCLNLTGFKENQSKNHEILAVF